MSELTPEERQKIYEEEKARLEARQALEGQKKEKKSTGGCLKVFLLLLVLITAAFIVASLTRTDSRPTRQSARTTSRSVQTPTAEDEKMIRDMKETLILDRINPSLNEAFVNPSQWASLKYEEKRNVGHFLAVYCGKKKGTGLNWVDIKDAYSGKVIAKYSESWGFKVY